MIISNRNRIEDAAPVTTVTRAFESETENGPQKGETLSEARIILNLR